MYMLVLARKLQYGFDCISRDDDAMYKYVCFENYQKVCLELEVQD